MTLRFAVFDLRAPEGDGPGLALDRTEALTRGAGLFGAQGGGLLFQEFLDGSLGHGTGRALGELFDIVGIEVELGTDLLLDASGHDFSPSLGHTLDPRGIYRRGLTEGHAMSLLGLRAQRGLGNLG
jgi:hypothetical protein